MSIKIGLVSLGCPKNQVDGEVLLGKILEDPTYVLCAEPALCDVVLINTCGFIDDAKRESIETILEFCQLKEETGISCVIATGCLAERYKDEVLKEIPELDGVVGIGKNAEIISIIEKALDGKKPAEYGSKYDLPMDGPRVLTTPSHYAYLKIAEGCSNRCTFCAIPSIRGDYRSRKMEEILKEAKELADFGVKELIIVAQDTTRYGIDLYGELKLSQLLSELCKIDGFKWIRLMYCYPDTITDELLQTIANNDKIVKYIDIPLQHINDTVLKRMNRRGDGKLIREVVAKIRKTVPGVFIRTTMIAGFPGETEEQFEELCEFIGEAKFERLGCFAYSIEEGTPAEKLDGHLDEEEKIRRSEIVMTKQAFIMGDLGETKVGTVQNVMVDYFDDEDGCYVGRTCFDAPEIDGMVRFKSDEFYGGGDFVDVKITAADDFDLYGVEV